MEIPTSHISISHFPIAFRHAFKSNPNYYTSHGRIYNNPRQPKEIWVTTGLGYHNKQINKYFLHLKVGWKHLQQNKNSKR